METLLAIVLTFGIAIAMRLLDRPRSRRAGNEPARDSPQVAALKAAHPLSQALPGLEAQLRSLFAAFGPGLARHSPVFFCPLSDGDQLRYAKQLIRDAAERYGVGPHDLRVRFAKGLNGSCAGCFRLEGPTADIDVSSRYQDDDTALTAIVAHEMAHLALRVRSIEAATTVQNELLTDSLAAMAGYGPVMLQSYYREYAFNTAPERLSVRSYQLGY